MIALVGNAQIAFDDVGSGLPVVFLHAFPLHRGMWAPQLGALLGQARCIAIDRRGFGDSSVRPPFTIDRFADDAIGVLDTLRIDRAVFVGLSMGGYEAFSIWRRHQPRVRALVLADTRAAADTDEGRERRRALIELAREHGSTAVAAKQIDSSVGKTTRRRLPDVVDAAHAMMTTAPVSGIVGALEAMMERPDSTPLLPTIDVPTLVIAGGEDAVTPAKEMRVMHQAIPGSKFEVIAEAGHLSSLERPAAFNTLLSEFFASLLYH